MMYPHSGTAAQLSEWLMSEYDQSTAEAFHGWKPNELLGASETTLKELAGKTVGGRLFGSMNTIKFTHAPASRCTSTTTVAMTPNNLLEFFTDLQSSVHKGTFNSRVKLLSDFDLGLPFVGRQDALDEIAGFYEEGISANEAQVSDRTKYPIPACAWIPGLGKTAVLHRGSEIFEILGVQGRQVHIIVPYYNGHSLQWIDKELSIESSFSWRLLFMVFLKWKGVEFPDLCTSNKLPFNSQDLTLPIALETVRLALLKDSKHPLDPEENLSIFVGIDEFQKVAEGKSAAMGKLTELCQKLHENRFKDKITMFPLFAGTDWELIQTSSESSGLPVKRVTMPPLNSQQATQLFEAVMGEKILFTSPLATHHLLTVGSLPRSLLNYCKAVKHAMQKDLVAVPSADHLNSAFEEVLTDNRGVWKSPTLLVKLMALCFTMEDVSNNTEITYVGVNNALERTSVTKLSNSGLCLVSPIPGGGGQYVTVPYMVVHLFAKCAERDMPTQAEKHLLRSVQWMVKNVDYVLYEKQPWQLFEDFGAAFNACRINSWQVLGHHTASIRDLWRGGASNVSPGLRVKLLPMSVVRAGEALSCKTGDTVRELRNGNNVIEWRSSASKPSHRGFVVINGESGEGVDSWVSLPSESNPNRVVTCAEQSKHAAVSTMSLAGISKLSEKVQSVCPNKRTTVVSCVRNSLPCLGPSVNAAKLPTNTIVVVRDHLQSHFGMFYRHPAVSPHVDINTCGKQRLFTMDLSMLTRGEGGKEEAIELVLERRATAKFVSMDDFQQFLASKGISCGVAQKQRLYAGTPNPIKHSLRSYSTKRAIIMEPSSTVFARAHRNVATGILGGNRKISSLLLKLFK
eukprot:gene10936-12760_t